MKCSKLPANTPDDARLAYLRRSIVLVSCAGSEHSIREGQKCESARMGAAPSRCAGSSCCTAKPQAFGGHEHALTHSQRKRAARMLAGSPGLVGAYENVAAASRF